MGLPEVLDYLYVLVALVAILVEILLCTIHGLAVRPLDNDTGNGRLRWYSR